MTEKRSPPPIHEFDTKGHDGPDSPKTSPSCPFCTIILTFSPVDPLGEDVSNENPLWSPQKLSPPAYVLLATEHVIAFLDIAPLTRGHVLVSPRRHRTKVGDMSPEEMSELGKLLPVIARSVIRAVLPDIPHREADYNIVQNNGPGAAQVVPHVHFHVIPRPPVDYRPVATSISAEMSPKAVQQTVRQASPKRSPPGKSAARTLQQRPARKNPPAKIPTGLRKSYVQFGRGFRHELDEDDAGSLIEEMRRCIGDEWRATFGETATSASEAPQQRDQGVSKGSSRAREKL